MEEIFNKIGTPKQIYSDRETAFHSVEFTRLLNRYKVKHIMVIDSAHTVERFNRTLKYHIQTRLDAQDLDKYKWTDQVDAVVNK